MTTVAIDGPSGVGKSSVSRESASRLGFGYLDTGAMYRAVVWLCLNRGVQEPGDVVEQIRGCDLEISTDPKNCYIEVDGIDVTEEIRTDEVTSNATIVSAVPDARAELIEKQREIIRAAGPGIVVEGRDITTVVAPDAEVRILMTARDEVRIARRTQQLHGSVDEASMKATAENVIGRDKKDSKTTSFLSAADGVHTLDTSDIDFEASVQAVLDLVEAARG